MMSCEEVFVDTSAWVALADRDDAFHAAAASVYPTLLRECARLVTSNLVVSETYLLVLHGLGHSSAVGFLEKAHASPRIVILYSDEETEADGAAILRKYADQDFSYTDAVSFALMKKRKIKKAFSFDKHFHTAGFERIP